MAPLKQPTVTLMGEQAAEAPAPTSFQRHEVPKNEPPFTQKQQSQQQQQRQLPAECAGSRLSCSPPKLPSANPGSAESPMATATAAAATAIVCSAAASQSSTSESDISSTSGSFRPKKQQFSIGRYFKGFIDIMHTNNADDSSNSNSSDSTLRTPSAEGGQSSVQLRWVLKDDNGASSSSSSGISLTTGDDVERVATHPNPQPSKNAKRHLKNGFRSVSVIEPSTKPRRSKINLSLFSSLQSLKLSSSTNAGVTSTAGSHFASNLQRSTSATNGISPGKNDQRYHLLSVAAGTDKKRKELSSSRVKKFFRHFPQISKDEKPINYFSCALVGDILLQGHLYITYSHFAFYSNVFGYVTKLLIPTLSVTKISKEKTAKIIPNAVGVATADEKHVFGSFISREAAFRLMSNVCQPIEPSELLLPKDVAQLEASEEYSIEDDSSCSVSGNESPGQLTENSSNAEQPSNAKDLPGKEATTGQLTAADNYWPAEDIPGNTKVKSIKSLLSTSVVEGGNTSAPTMCEGDETTLETETNNGCAFLRLTSGDGSSNASTPTSSTSSSQPTTVAVQPLSRTNHLLASCRAAARNAIFQLKYPTEVPVVYLGVIITIMLALLTIFLLIRITYIETVLPRASFLHLNWHSDLQSDGILAETLRFQRELQLRSAEEAQSILQNNLDHIARVRRSLETLSLLLREHQPETDIGEKN